MNSVNDIASQLQYIFRTTINDICFPMLSGKYRKIPEKKKIRYKASFKTRYHLFIPHSIPYTIQTIENLKTTNKNDIALFSVVF